jgi:glycosyltransferase involved in cell wall biosynthesis
MRIAHLTSVHPADDVRILHKECRTLASAGYDVRLVAAGTPETELAGIPIVAVHGGSRRGDRMTRTAWRVFRAARRLRAEVYHFHDPELIPFGVMLRADGARVIYDAHEDLPRDVLQKEWLPGIIRPLVSLAAEATEAIAARLLDGIVAATPPIARRFPASKTVLVQNFPPLADVQGVVPHRDREPIAAYVGALSTERGALAMARAAALLPAESGARVVLAGSFTPERLADDVLGAGAGRVELTGWLGRDAVRDLLGRARIGLVLFEPAPNHVESYPTKLFEYMAAGLPIVASDFPLWRRIVADAGCGLTVDPCSPAAIAAAIERLLGDPEEGESMGARGRRAVEREYSWEREASKLLSFYGTLTGGPTVTR